jgi:hypothetical protein
MTAMSAGLAGASVEVCAFGDVSDDRARQNP